MKMTGLEIFKYLPAAKKEEHSNCRECGCPTCMAFALKLAKELIEIDKCPYYNPELKEKYFHSVKHAQNTINIGRLAIGGENVLYRHEKTFINPTILAVMIDCSSKDWEDKYKRVSNFKIKGVNKEFTIDCIIFKNRIIEIDLPEGIESIDYDEYLSLKLDKITGDDFIKTKEHLITSRTKAIFEKDDNYSKPVCVFLNHDNIFSLCAKSSYYICKYANMIVFEDFDEAMFSTSIRLRENLYTDPQKPLQVESSLYEFNNPDENSIVLLTTNFALTYFAVSNELETLDIPTYLIVIPSDGMSVLTAWSAEKFTPEIVAKTLQDLNIREKLKTRKIIIPGLLDHMTEELNEHIKDFEFIAGTTEATDLGNFIKNLK